MLTRFRRISSTFKYLWRLSPLHPYTLPKLKKLIRNLLMATRSDIILRVPYVGEPLCSFTLDHSDTTSIIIFVQIKYFGCRPSSVNIDYTPTTYLNILYCSQSARFVKTVTSHCNSITSISKYTNKLLTCLSSHVL